MPGIGNEHGRAQPLSIMQHVTEQSFFRHERQDGDPQGEGGRGFEVLQLDACAPNDAGAGRRRNGAQGEGGRRLDAGMTVGMALVGGVFAEVGSDEDEKVAHQIGKGMQAVSDQALGVGENTGDYLRGGR